METAFHRCQWGNSRARRGRLTKRQLRMSPTWPCSLTGVLLSAAKECTSSLPSLPSTTQSLPSGDTSMHSICIVNRQLANLWVKTKHTPFGRISRNTCFGSLTSCFSTCRDLHETKKLVSIV